MFVKLLIFIEKIPEQKTQGQIVLCVNTFISGLVTDKQEFIVFDSTGVWCYTFKNDTLEKLTGNVKISTMISIAGTMKRNI